MRITTLEMPTNAYDNVFQTIGAKYGLDWRLLKAIAWHESGVDPSQVDLSDPSIGMMQVLCSGYPEAPTCTNKFYINNWPPSSSADLFDPTTNVDYAAQILSANLSRYGFPKGIAVYNDWGSRDAPTNGPFHNQAYVDDVISKYNALKQAQPIP